MTELGRIPRRLGRCKLQRLRLCDTHTRLWRLINYLNSRRYEMRRRGQVPAVQRIPECVAIVSNGLVGLSTLRGWMMSFWLASAGRPGQHRWSTRETALSWYDYALSMAVRDELSCKPRDGFPLLQVRAGTHIRYAECHLLRSHSS